MSHLCELDGSQRISSLLLYTWKKLWMGTFTLTVSLIVIPPYGCEIGKVIRQMPILAKQSHFSRRPARGETR